MILCPIQGSTEIANFDFRGDGRFTLEVEEEARDCFSWQEDQVNDNHDDKDDKDQDDKENEDHDDKENEDHDDQDDENKEDQVRVFLKTFLFYFVLSQNN